MLLRFDVRFGCLCFIRLVWAVYWLLCACCCLYCCMFVGFLDVMEVVGV